jgi:hypothetical protein
MASIADVVGRIKQDLGQAISTDRIASVCHELKLQWRERELDPPTTFALLLQQVLHGNCACNEVRHLPAAAGREFTASAYCQARQRLPQKLLDRISADVAGIVAADSGEHRWRGHRVWHIDGSSFGMPDTPELRLHFGLPNGVKEGCGFPSAHLLVMFSASTGALLKTVVSPLNTADLTNTPLCHEKMEAGDVAVGDSHFGSYGHLAVLAARGCHGLFAVPSSRIVSFTPDRPHAESSADVGLPRSHWVASLGENDQLVWWIKPTVKPKWMAAEQWEQVPGKLLVRELRRSVSGAAGKVTLTMVTTLTDATEYPAEALLDLRQRRWDVETDLGSLKTTMGMDVLRCKTVAGVKKELTMFALAYNLVRAAMTEAARRQQVSVRQVSFADTLQWMRHARAGDEMPRMMLVRHRPGRAEPRVRKRRGKIYDHMTKPRDKLRAALKFRVRRA